MTDLVLYSSGANITRAERRAAKEIALMRAASSVLAAREAAKVDAIAEVAQTAVVAAAELSVLESALATRTPQAAGRMAYINDRACTAMGGVITTMARRL